MSQIQKVKTLSKPGDPAPQNLLDRAISSTPVVMTVVATILAGLSSSEMSTAQYHRALAAQFQSKAGDQWNLFQAKRLRQNSNENLLELMEGLSSGRRLEPDEAATASHQIGEDLTALLSRLTGAQKASDSGAAGPTTAAEASQPPASHTSRASALQPKAAALGEQWNAALVDPKMLAAIHYLSSDDLPHVDENKVEAPNVAAVLAAIDANQTELQTIDLVRKVSRKEMNAAEATASDNSKAFDAAIKPISAAIERLATLVSSQATLVNDAVALANAAPSAVGDTSILRDDAQRLSDRAKRLSGSFAASRLRFDGRRYKEESRYNMAIAQLLEVEVRRSSGESDRNRIRSKDFFYGMLAAQAAVTIATLSLAVRQRSLLWALASAAGLIAIILGIYVYLAV